MDVRDYVQFAEPPWHASLRLCFRNGGFLRRRGDSELMSPPCMEVRRECLVSRQRTGSHPQEVKQTICRLRIRLTLSSAAQQSAKSVARVAPQGITSGTHHACCIPCSAVLYAVFGDHNSFRTEDRTPRAPAAVIMQLSCAVSLQDEPG